MSCGCMGRMSKWSSNLHNGLKKPPCQRLKRKQRLSGKRCSLLAFSTSEVLCIVSLFLELQTVSQEYNLTILWHLSESMRQIACTMCVYQFIYLKNFSNSMLTRRFKKSFKIKLHSNIFCGCHHHQGKSSYPGQYMAMVNCAITHRSTLSSPSQHMRSIDVRFLPIY